MDAPHELAVNWERYWHDLPATPGAAVWDSDSSAAASEHLPLFEQHFTTGLPVLDLGCGNGTQTALLGRHYGRVIGLDVSASAIERARASHTSDVVQFREFDLLDSAAVAALHAELGDANVYMRGIVHQIPAPDKAAAVRTVATLLGGSGRVFAIELAAAAKEIIGVAVSGDAESAPKLRQVLAYGLTPAEWPAGGMEQLLVEAGLTVLASGSTTLRTTDHFADGSPIELPMQYLVAGSS